VIKSGSPIDLVHALVRITTVKAMAGSARILDQRVEIHMDSTGYCGIDVWYKWIPRAMVNVLLAIPGTPLYDRLLREGRLYGNGASDLLGFGHVFKQRDPAADEPARRATYS
jgi:hypothetical protein